MGSFQFLLNYRPFLPWICSSLALGYAAYITWKLKRIQEDGKKRPMNIDQDNFPAKHEVNIDTIDRNCQIEAKDDAIMTCCSDQKSDDCCSKEDANGSVIQFPQCRRTAFAFFLSENINQKLDQVGKDQSSVKFAKDCARKWKELPPEEKAYYHKLSKDDKNRYKLEIQEYKKRIESQKESPELSATNIVDCWQENDTHEQLDVVDVLPENIADDQSISEPNELKELSVQSTTTVSLIEDANENIPKTQNEASKLSLTLNEPLREEEKPVLESNTVDENLALPSTFETIQHDDSLVESDSFKDNDSFKPFSGDENNLDDIAFDFFCTDEMPKVREKFSPQQRRMSGEEMLDELLLRWEMLPTVLKNDYFYKAMQSL